MSSSKNLASILLAMANAAFPSELSNGVSEATLDACEKSMGFALPAPLRDFYHTVGANDHVAASDHKFVPPGQLRVNNGVMVFCRENQNIISWGTALADIFETDPPVMQMVDSSGAWTNRYKRTSIFIAHMTCWQIINALPSMGRCPVDYRLIKSFRDDMTVVCPAIGYGMNSSVDFQRGVFVTVLSDTDEIYVGARDDGSLEEFAKRKQIDLDWL